MASVADPFYLPEGETAAGGWRFAATEQTRGPWDPGAQHAGPPAALLGRAIEGLPDSGDLQVGRLTFEILGPVPIGAVEVEARIARPGRRVQMVEAELAVDGEPRMRARGWRLRRQKLEIPAEARIGGPAPPLPDGDGSGSFFPGAHDAGYHTAMEVRFAAGGWTEPGPATGWLRMRVPLVGDEEPSPLQRTLVAADVGNGISSALDFRKWVFINVDLTVQLERLPKGEWICVDAATHPRGSGIGSSDSVLSDQGGRIGRALQTLLFSQR
jgi:hypothetical protein